MPYTSKKFLWPWPKDGLDYRLVLAPAARALVCHATGAGASICADGLRLGRGYLHFLLKCLCRWLRVRHLAQRLLNLLGHLMALGSSRGIVGQRGSASFVGIFSTELSWVCIKVCIHACMAVCVHVLMLRCTTGRRCGASSVVGLLSRIPR